MSDRKGFGNIEEIMDKTVNRTNHLLGIAINDYQDCPKLNNAVKDVQDFIDLMKTQFAFEEENIDFLFNEAATGSNIIRKLDELSEKLTSNDNLIIYFSGHGAMHPKHNKGYWIPIDGRQDDYFTYVPNTVVKDHLGSINAHHIFLIADSCFSGALFTKGARNVGKRLEKYPSRWGLTSGQKEIVLDGKPGGNSPFATSLLKNLRKTTRPIAVQELCLQVLEMTAANAVQTPLGEPLQVKGHENGQFVFRLKKDEIRDWAKAQNEEIAGLQQFLAIYPDGQFAEAAKTKIDNLKAEKAWKRIENSKTSLDFARFKRQFPKSKYAAEAERLLPIKEEDEEWQAAKEANKITRYERYLRLYKTGRYQKEAIAAINAILDTEKPKERYEKTPVVVPTKTKTTAQQPTTKPKTPSKPMVDWQKLPWKKIGIAAMVLIGIIALVQSGIFSPKPKLTFEEVDNLIGLKSGNEWLIKPKYFANRDFQEGLAAVDLDNKWGYINEKGAIVIEHQYTTANSFVDGLAAVCDGDSSCGFINKKGEIIIPLIYESTASFESNGDMVWVQKDGKAFYINKKGECVQDCPEAAEEITETVEQGEEEATEENETEEATIEKPKPVVEKPARTSDPFAGQMIKIPSGTFQMGSNERNDEKPIHSVTVSSFYMSKYEVTQKQWRDIMGTTIQQQRDKANKEWPLRGVGDDYPMYYVSWNEIQEFIKKLNAKTGNNYRLPTEAEWEYAAKGGQNYKYAGSDNIGSVAWYDGNSSNKTHPVGQKSPNGYGLYDMSGNVWEWCSDWYDEDYYKNSPSNNPKGASSGVDRVLRGGSWGSTSEDCRTANRGFNTPSSRSTGGGFRLVLP